MERRNLILSVLVVLQVALIAFFFWPGSNSQATAGKLFANLKAAEVTALSVADETTTVKLAKSDTGWALPDADNFPVREVQVSELISKLLTITTSRLAAQNAANHERLQVADGKFVRKVELTDQAGKSTTFYVGSAPNTLATNVRRGDNDNVYISGDIQASDLHTDLANWIDTQYVAVPAEQATALTIENAQGKLEFTRVNTTTWELKGLAASESFTEANFTTTLTRLSGLNMVKPLSKTAKAEWGMDKPQATVTIASQDGQSIALQIGAKEGENYVVKSSAADYYVEVASFSVESFINEGRERYVGAPPVPAATTAPFGFITDTVGISATAPISGGVTPAASLPITTTETVTK